MPMILIPNLKRVVKPSSKGDPHPSVTPRRPVFVCPTSWRPVRSVSRTLRGECMVNCS